MIVELETTIMLWLQTKKYKEEDLAESYVVSRGNKPGGNSVIIIDFNNPIKQKPKEQRIGSKRKKIQGQGTITFFYHAIDEETGEEIEDAEEKNDVIPDLVVDWIFDDPDLNGTIPGEITIIKYAKGNLDTKREKDSYPFISYIVFEYEGLYVKPIIE